MKHNQVSAICRKIAAQALGISEDELPQQPWDSVIYDFAKEADQMEYPEEFVRKEFQYCVTQIISQQAYWSEAMQRHHDYYVFLFRQGNLSREDNAQYQLAMERENNGQVRPLPADAVSPFG